MVFEWLKIRNNTSFMWLMTASRRSMCCNRSWDCIRCFSISRSLRTRFFVSEETRSFIIILIRNYLDRKASNRVVSACCACVIASFIRRNEIFEILTNCSFNFSPVHQLTVLVQAPKTKTQKLKSKLITENGNDNANVQEQPRHVCEVLQHAIRAAIGSVQYPPLSPTIEYIKHINKQRTIQAINQSWLVTVPIVRQLHLRFALVRQLALAQYRPTSLLRPISKRRSKWIKYECK